MFAFSNGSADAMETLLKSHQGIQGSEPNGLHMASSVSGSKASISNLRSCMLSVPFAMRNSDLSTFQFATA